MLSNDGTGEEERYTKYLTEQSSNPGSRQITPLPDWLVEGQLWSKFVLLSYVMAGHRALSIGVFYEDAWNKWYTWKMTGLLGWGAAGLRDLSYLAWSDNQTTSQQPSLLLNNSLYQIDLHITYNLLQSFIYRTDFPRKAADRWTMIGIEVCRDTSKLCIIYCAECNLPRASANHKTRLRYLVYLSLQSWYLHGCLSNWYILLQILVFQTLQRCHG